MTAIPKSVFQEPQAAPLATPGRRLIALTRDEGLVAALQELSGAGVNIAVVNDSAELVDELLVAPGSIALVDAAASTAPLEQLVDSLAAQFPETRLLMAGNSLEQGLLATRIASQRVYRFVHKPASAQRLKLFIDAANRAVDLARAGSAQAVEVLKPATATVTRGGGIGSRGKLIAGMVVLAALVVAAGVSLLRRPHATPKAPPSAVATAHPVDALVQSADQAFAQSHFLDRDGSSASELYQKALGAAPDDERARSGLARSIDFGLRGIEAALTAGELDSAEQQIDAARSVAPRNSRLEFLVTQLAREREHANSDASRRSVAEGQKAQLRAKLDASADALRRGALLDPADDNALYHLRAAERIAPADAQVAALRMTLVSRLLGAAESSLNAGQVPPARRLLDAAGVLGAESALLERLRRQADQTTADAVMASRAPVAPPAPPVEIAPPSAVVAAPVVEAPPKNSQPELVSAASLKRVHSVDPEFPTRALVLSISGWVKLEFTVQPDGSVRDVVARESEPRGIFDRAAIEAMRHWRFAPILKDGQPVEQRAWLRMRFTPQSN